MEAFCNIEDVDLIIYSVDVASNWYLKGRVGRVCKNVNRINEAYRLIAKEKT
jgi:hypothetical protein